MLTPREHVRSVLAQSRMMKAVVVVAHYRMCPVLLDSFIVRRCSLLSCLLDKLCGQGEQLYMWTYADQEQEQLQPPHY